MNSKPIKRALISVSDKTGVVEFATMLQKWDVEILSTGGTARLLENAGIPVVHVSDYTGAAEMMDGRVKTLHPKIHGALLGRRDIDKTVMAEQGIVPIDLLVVNLYPFLQVIQDPRCNLATAVENIDIGGPCMLRAGAKNHAAVAVVVNPRDYALVLEELQQEKGAVSAKTREALATKAFVHTAQYDSAIANYLKTQQTEEASPTFPSTLSVTLEKVQDLRYGENPHQQAAFYTAKNPPNNSLACAQQLQGKALSFNNLVDADTAWECVKTFQAPACVIVKHANPCGIAMRENVLNAYERAFATDPTSSFGGIIAFNAPVEGETAQAILAKQFVEVVIAPAFNQDALGVFQQKSNVRLLQIAHTAVSMTEYDLKKITGGLLVQQQDTGHVSEDDLKIVTQRSPTPAEITDLLFTWNVAKYVKSNAIVYGKANATIGIGAGQMSRVYSAKVANMKAQEEGLPVEGSVMASDAFFPFRDAIDAAAEVGIRAIIQPGGSIRDAEVIAAANEHDIAMVFSQMRHFRH